MRNLLTEFCEAIAVCAAVGIAVFSAPPILYFWQQWVEFWK